MFEERRQLSENKGQLSEKMAIIESFCSFLEELQRTKRGRLPTREVGLQNGEEQKKRSWRKDEKKK